MTTYGDITPDAAGKHLRAVTQKFEETIHNPQSNLCVDEFTGAQGKPKNWCVEDTRLNHAGSVVKRFATEAAAARWVARNPGSWRIVFDEELTSSLNI